MRSLILKLAILALFLSKIGSLSLQSRLRVRQGQVLNAAGNPAAIDALRKLDINMDGHVSVGELLNAPLEAISHDPIVAKILSRMKSLFAEKATLVRSAGLMSQIRAIMEVPDLIFLALCVILHKRLLRGLHAGLQALTAKLQPWNSSKDGARNKGSESYEGSFFGYIEQPTTALVFYLPFLYIVDIASIVLHQLGFTFHIKGDIPRLIYTIASSFIWGCYITRIKDWILNMRRAAQHSKARDKVREGTVDELTSLVVWAAAGVFCLEAMSLELGFALGSVFAVGGIGSASIVLALRSTMENIVGGLLLKLQDKIRVGERITIPTTAKEKGKGEEGYVEEINYVTTTIRREDNSLMAVPNHIFTHGEIINWSRTPFRLFTTSVTLGANDLTALPSVVAKIRDGLQVSFWGRSIAPLLASLRREQFI